MLELYDLPKILISLVGGNASSCFVFDLKLVIY